MRGQATALWIDGALIVNVYLAHRHERRNFCTELHSSFRSIAGAAQFLVVGDWNFILEENPMVATFYGYNGRLIAPTKPIRWNGRRVVDYAVCHV